jgi:CRP/FNR family cyclic AMP-dependent transcriptional regulator
VSKSSPPQCDLDLLAGVPLFAGLDTDELRAIASVAKPIQHPSGEVVIAAGTRGGRFFVIQSGEADVVSDDVVVASLAAGDYFGELSLLDGERRSASVVATSALRTWSIAHFNFQPLLLEHPILAVGLLTALGRRLRAAERSLLS